MQGKRAVVLGGSVAGLCSAGALAPHFESVVVLERDDLPVDAEHRRGVPQSKHPHFVLNSGRRAIGRIFPGFEDALIAEGGQLLMPSLDAAYAEKDGWAPRKTGVMTMVYSSRILIERVMRDKVRLLPNVEIREGVSVTGLLTRDGGTDAGRVTGAEFRTDGGDPQTIDADLVVDCLGRGSSVAEWLAAAGWPTIAERTLDAKVTYTSRWYELPPAAEQPESWWWKHMVITPTQARGPHPDEHEYLSNFFPIEGNRAIVCMGSWGLDLARKSDAFEASVERVRTPSFAATVRECTPVSEVHLTRSTGNKWRRYDLLERPLIGLVSIGDAACGFNPFYGQGMSSAARSAVILADVLESHDPSDARFFAEFRSRQKESLDVPWMLAMARDQGYAFATGTEVVPAWRRRILAALSWPIFNTITGASREDPYIDEVFGAVFNLDKSMRQMMTDPRFLFGLLRYRVRALLGRTKLPSGFDLRYDPPATDYSDSDHVASVESPSVEAESQPVGAAR